MARDSVLDGLSAGSKDTKYRNIPEKEFLRIYSYVISKYSLGLVFILLSIEKSTKHASIVLLHRPETCLFETGAFMQNNVIIPVSASMKVGYAKASCGLSILPPRWLRALSFF